jgi:hypothetical protein
MLAAVLGTDHETLIQLTNDWIDNHLLQALILVRDLNLPNSSNWRDFKSNSPQIKAALIAGSLSHNLDILDLDNGDVLQNRAANSLGHWVIGLNRSGSILLWDSNHSDNKQSTLKYGPATPILGGGKRKLRKRNDQKLPIFEERLCSTTSKNFRWALQHSLGVQQITLNPSGEEGICSWLTLQHALGKNILTIQEKLKSYISDNEDTCLALGKQYMDFSNLQQVYEHLFSYGEWQGSLLFHLTAKIWKKDILVLSPDPAKNCIFEGDPHNAPIWIIHFNYHNFRGDPNHYGALSDPILLASSGRKSNRVLLSEITDAQKQGAPFRLVQNWVRSSMSNQTKLFAPVTKTTSIRKKRVSPGLDQTEPARKKRNFQEPVKNANRGP